MPVRNARWTRIDGLDQWELGFETDEAGMSAGTAACVSRVGDELISSRRLDVMIGYSQTTGPAS
jgi:hypothetical protein